MKGTYVGQPSPFKDLPPAGLDDDVDSPQPAPPHRVGSITNIFESSQGHAQRRREALIGGSDFVEHTWPLEKLTEHYHTDALQGLSSMQVKINRGKYGPNRLSPRAGMPAWQKYLLQYTNFFAILLVVASLLCFLAFIIDDTHDHTNLYLGLVLLVVVVATATFAYFQEAKSKHVMDGFRRMVPTRCHVIRDGVDYVLDVVELVPGDVVELADGDRVPADIRLVRAADLMVDNSALTGESEPVERTPELIRDADGNLLMDVLEAKNLCFYTTMVTGGVGRGIVIGSGDRTVMGQIAGMAAETKNLESPLAREISNFIRLIAMLAIAMGLLFFALSLALGEGIIHTMVFAIGVITANVPEGLMAAVTVSLAMAAKRMHGKNVLVKNLESVETLGSATVIASDKTGTLTQNRMTVQHCWYDWKVFVAPPARNRPDLESLLRTSPEVLGGEPYSVQSPSFQRLQMIATLCNNASFTTTRDMAHEMQQVESDVLALESSGDASEQGLLRFLEPLASCKEYRDRWPKLFEIKFTSHNKWQLSIHRQPGDVEQAPVLVLKGAPERVLDRCSKILVEGRHQNITEVARSHFHSAYEQLGGFGERVLGFAYLELEGFSNSYEFTNRPEPNFPTEGLVFAGLISLIDPPRKGVREAVEKCKRAHIQVFMVTGDHPTTAAAIAQQVGILDQEKLESNRALVVTGGDIRQWEELPSISEKQAVWDNALSHEQLVFARVSPAHKLLIAENCQRRGEIVAVTGDGVNDAPALKKADIGIAMGMSGKDVSKEAADMILMDDNFASIVNGVEEGRVIFDNLKKTICYALTVNIPELIPFLCNVLLRIPLPLTTVLMLAISLGTDMLPAISLAYETKESDIMDRPPRSKKDPLVSGRLLSHAYLQIGILQAFAGFLAYLAVLNDYGYVPRILVNRGLQWERHSLICLVDSKNEPTVCGYGCGLPDYKQGLNHTVQYCEDGCFIPQQEQVADPFSEFNSSGFRGVEYCSLSCQSSPDLFPGGVLPQQCVDPTIYKQVGFPGRKRIGKPHAPVGGKYWWGRKQQLRPNHKYQKEVLHYAQTAYFLACVITQWANLIVCKTRKLSVFQQGMHNNLLNFSLIFELLVAACLLYISPFQAVFKTRPLNIMYWFIGIPFTLAIFIVGEIRKLQLRLKPGGWVDRWTYW